MEKNPKTIGCSNERCGTNITTLPNSGQDNRSEHVLTCELQRGAQGALSRGQQRQAAVFGLRVLQTLHQWDGRVLHKLHQQLSDGEGEEAQHGKKDEPRVLFNRSLHHKVVSLRRAKMMASLPLVWSQAHQKAWVTLCGTCRAK